MSRHYKAARATLPTVGLAAPVVAPEASIQSSPVSLPADAVYIDNTPQRLFSPLEGGNRDPLVEGYDSGAPPPAPTGYHPEVKLFPAESEAAAAPMPPPKSGDLRRIELQFLHCLVMSDFAAAEASLKEILSIDSTYNQNADILRQFATHLTLKHAIATRDPNNPTVIYRPNEIIIAWLISHGFATGDVVNDMIRRFAKTRFTRVIDNLSPIQADLSEALVHHDILAKVIEKTPVHVIADDILMRIYEYTPLVFEKMVLNGLDIRRRITDPSTNTTHSIAWYAMRVSKRQIIPSEKGSPITYAHRFYSPFKMASGYAPQPEDFEGCNEMSIMNDLLNNPTFVSAIQKPIEALEGRYLIETITDDRIQNLLRNRGSPDPKVSLFDRSIVNSEFFLQPALNTARESNKESIVTARSTEDYTLFGHSLLWGNYTSGHFTCLKIILVEIGDGAFVPNVINQSNAVYDLAWMPLHIAASRFDLKAWQRYKLIKSRKPVPGTQQMEPQAPVVYPSLKDVPETNGSQQVDIMQWLYEMGTKSFGLDRYKRTPLMCLPISDEWMEPEGIQAMREILDEFLPAELKLLQQKCNIKILEPSFREAFASWRLREHNDRKRSYAARAKHANQGILRDSFPFT